MKLDRRRFVRVFIPMATMLVGLGGWLAFSDGWRLAALKACIERGLESVMLRDETVRAFMSDARSRGRLRSRVAFSLMAWSGHLGAILFSTGALDGSVVPRVARKFVLSTNHLTDPRVRAGVEPAQYRGYIDGITHCRNPIADFSLETTAAQTARRAAAMTRARGGR